MACRIERNVQGVQRLKQRMSASSSEILCLHPGTKKTQRFTLLPENIAGRFHCPAGFPLQMDRRGDDQSMNELTYIEDKQGFLLRLLRQGQGRWPDLHCITQKDYLSLKLLHGHNLNGEGMQHIKDALTDPSLRYLSIPGTRYRNAKRLREAHRLIVLQALRKGCFVPHDVLDDYPEFRELAVRELPDGSTQVRLYGEIVLLSQEEVALFHQLRNGLETCSTLYRCQADPYPEPERLLDLNNSGSEGEGAWYEFSQKYRQIRTRFKGTTPFAQVITRLIDNEIHQLTVWFRIYGYDETHIPAPPSLDHTTMHERPDGWGLKPAVVFGPIGCCGWEHPEQGGVTVFLNTSGYSIAYWNALQLLPSRTLWTRRKTEEVWDIARKMSQLTDWTVVFEQPRPVKRAILAKFRSLIEPNQGWIEEAFVKRFQLD